MSYLTAGKVAVITGGSTGRGKDVAEKLVKLGCKVVIGDTLDDEGRATVKLLNSFSAKSALYLHTDTTVYEDVNALFGLAESKFGRVDIVVLDSGEFTITDPKSIAEDGLSRRYNLGLVKCTRVAVLRMHKRGGGVIISTVSISGPKESEAEEGARIDIVLAKYSATKHSIHMSLEVLGLLDIMCHAAARAVSPCLAAEDNAKRPDSSVPRLKKALIEMEEFVSKLERLMLSRGEFSSLTNHIVDRILALMREPDYNIQAFIASTPDVYVDRIVNNTKPKHDPQLEIIMKECRQRVRNSFEDRLGKLDGEDQKRLREDMEDMLKDLSRKGVRKLLDSEYSEDRFREKFQKYLSERMSRVFAPRLGLALEANFSSDYE